MEKEYQGTKLALHKETTFGSTDKADEARKRAEKYTDEQIAKMDYVPGDVNSPEEIQRKIDQHITNEARHTSPEDRASWNAKETTASVLQKVSVGVAEAKKYTDAESRAVLRESNAYAMQKVLNLLDGSPETLDTFRKIANALGNDPEFATTLSEKINAKLDQEEFDNFVKEYESNQIGEATEEARGLMSALDKQRSNGYVHNQVASSSTWKITHNLKKIPSVTLVDSGGSVIIGSVLHTSINEVEISYTSSFSGTAYLN